jgi:ubiquinone/menaquinone biosynthesis C-methylase UbiE
VSFTARFTERASAYAVGRPSYPDAAIDVLLEGLGARAALAVADLGAGTGISSRAIAERGPRVFAVEPNAAMRENAEPHERVTWIAGTAEATTLADAAVDVVTAFQAWHWVDHPAAVAEARRILRPGGRMAAIYNEFDQRDPFTAAFEAMFRTFSTADIAGRRGHGLTAFETIAPERTRRFHFDNPFDVGRAGVHRHAESQSYLPRTGDAARAMHDHIDQLADAHERDGALALHFITIVVRVEEP